MHLEDTDIAIKQLQGNMRNSHGVGLETRKPDYTLEEMHITTGDSLRYLASYEEVKDGDNPGDDEQDTELSKLNQYDEPGRVMGTISQMVQQSI